MKSDVKETTPAQIAAKFHRKSILRSMKNAPFRHILMLIMVMMAFSQVSFFIFMPDFQYFPIIFFIWMAVYVIFIISSIPLIVISFRNQEKQDKQLAALIYILNKRPIDLDWIALIFCIGAFLGIIVLSTIGLIIIFIMGIYYLLATYYFAIVILLITASPYFIIRIASKHGLSYGDVYCTLLHNGKQVRTLKNDQNKIELKDASKWHLAMPWYGYKMIKNHLIWGFERTRNSFILYLPSLNFVDLRFFKKWDPAKSSRVEAFDDGTVTAHISEDDHKLLGIGTSDQGLSPSATKVFSRSITAFLEGKEAEAMDIVGGRDFVQNRRRVVRSKMLFYLRLGALFMLMNVFLIGGVIPQERTVIDKDLSSSDCGANNSLEILLKAYHFSVSLLMTNSTIYQHDRLLVKFKADLPLECAYLFRTNSSEPTSRTLTNVSAGEFEIDARQVTTRVKENDTETSSTYMYGYYLRLVFSNGTGNGTVTNSVHLHVKHLNAPGMLNIWIGLALIPTFIIFEAIYRKLGKKK